MQVIKSTAFQESMLISTTATEAYSAWSSGTTYAITNRVTYLGKIWESLQSSNTNHQPNTSPTWWVDQGPDNRHAMFDRAVSTGTTAGTSLTVVIAPGMVDSLALINLDTTTVTITIRDGLAGPIVYGPYTGGLSGVTVTDWYQYFFYDPLLKRTQLVFTNLPPYTNAHITLEFASTSTTSVGECVFGILSDVGMTQYGASAGIIDFSVKQTDEFGTVTFVERPFSKRLNAQVIIKNSQLNRVQQLLYSLRATPAVWIASDNPQFEEAMIVYGWYKDFTTEISYPAYASCSIEIEGLT